MCISLGIPIVVRALANMNASLAQNLPVMLNDDLLSVIFGLVPDDYLYRLRLVNARFRDIANVALGRITLQWKTPLPLGIDMNWFRGSVCYRDATILHEPHIVYRGFANARSVDVVYTGMFLPEDEDLAAACRMAKLGCLRVDNGEHIKNLPVEIMAECGNLRTVRLSCWRVTNAKPFFVSKTACIEELDLRGSSCVGNGGFASIAALPTLLRLYLGGCALICNDVTLDSIEWGDGITILDLSKSLRNLTAASMFRVGKIRNLHTLDLSMCMRIDDDALAALAEGRPPLIDLNISSCPVGDAGIEHIAKLPTLKRINISSNPHLTDDAARHISTAKSIEYIDAMDCPAFTAGAVMHFATLHNLRKLHMECCPELTDDVARHIVDGECAGTIEDVSFSFCPMVTQATREKLGECPRLAAWSAEGNEFRAYADGVGACLEWFSDDDDDDDDFLEGDQYAEDFALAASMHI